MIHESYGADYVAAATLDEARAQVDFAVVLSGDWGGQVYLTAPVGMVTCTDEVLRQLLEDLDSVQWDELEGATLAFEQARPGSAVVGGMGGGHVTEGVWVHGAVQPPIAAAAAEVILGERTRIPLELLARYSTAERRRRDTERLEQAPFVLRLLRRIR